VSASETCTGHRVLADGIILFWAGLRAYWSFIDSSLAFAGNGQCAWLG